MTLGVTSQDYAPLKIYLESACGLALMGTLESVLRMLYLTAWCWIAPEGEATGQRTNIKVGINQEGG